MMTKQQKFYDTLKYGKSYVLIKNHVDILCEAITNKLDGKYSIRYIARPQLFIVSIYDVPSWSNLPRNDAATYTAENKNLFVTARHFAASYLDLTVCSWNTTYCQKTAKVEYHISHYW